MADRYFGQARNRRLERAQIRLAQIVAGVDRQTRLLRAPCGFHATRQLFLSLAFFEGLRIRASINFHAFHADRDSRFKERRSGIDEDAHPAADAAQPSDQRREAFDIALHIEAVIGGNLTVTVRHQRDLRGAYFASQFDEAGIRTARWREGVALDVVLDAGAR